MPSFQPYWGKPAVRNDKGDRGDVGIIRSPVRASILPDCGGCPAMGIPTAILGRRRSIPYRAEIGSSGWRLCENAQEPTKKSIIFSIDLFPIAATAIFLFRLPKSRKAFYAQIECLCFHTASTRRG